MFFSSLKLQYCPAILLLNFSKKSLFQKRRWSCDFPPRKTPVAPKAPKGTTRFPAKKKSIIHPPQPVGLSCYSFPPPPESVRAYADVTTKISWMDRLPDFLSYSAPLARWRAGSVMNAISSVVTYTRMKSRCSRTRENKETARSL